MKRNNSLRGAGVLLITTILLFTTIVVTAETNEQQMNISTHIVEQTQTNSGQMIQDVLWDNGMEWIGLAASQNDTVSGLDPICADDFLIEEDVNILDVHWIGGYWNGADDGDFDWEVTFYHDDGTGDKPGDIIDSFYYPNAEVNEVWVNGTPGGSNYYSYDVVLPDALTLGEGKYWLSIQAYGEFAPQSGWAYHEDPIKLHMGVFKSAYFGFPDWTNSEDVFGQPVDHCFQITGEPLKPDLELVSAAGGIGCSVDIKNNGTADAVDVQWSIAFNGGLIIMPSGGVVEGTVDIPVGETVTVQSGFVFGFGGLINPLDVTITATHPADTEEATIPGRLILVFFMFI